MPPTTSPQHVIACQHPSSRGIVPREALRSLAERLVWWNPELGMLRFEEWLRELGVEVYDWPGWAQGLPDPDNAKLSPRAPMAWRFPSED